MHDQIPQAPHGTHFQWKSGQPAWHTGSRVYQMLAYLWDPRKTLDQRIPGARAFPDARIQLVSGMVRGLPAGYYQWSRVYLRPGHSRDQVCSRPGRRHGPR